jgi:chromate reductase, NAD(P)H dehydrogenase (quinone)
MKNILAISGSTRKTSTNYKLISAIADLTKDAFNISVYEGIERLPHFNPDDNDNAPQVVISFRHRVATADAVIICTPEYAHGVPGSLKNAIDWCISSNAFSEKPTALITASTDGTNAHQSLLETLRTIEAKNVEQHQLLIQFAGTKVGNGIITDDKTLKEIISLLQSLKCTIGC